MRVVVLLAALRHEHALAQPAERGDARLGLGHVTDRPAPRLIADEPADRAALEVRLVVCAEHPERHSISEMDRRVPLLVPVAGKERLHRRAVLEELVQPRLRLILGVVVGLVEPQRRAGQVGDDVAEAEFADARLARLNRRDDEHQADAGVDQGFERLADLRRVVRAKAAGNRRIRNRADVLLGPGPRRAPIRRTPCLAPNTDELLVHPACSTESTSSMALRHSS